MKLKNYFLLIFFLFHLNCSNSYYRRLALENPRELIAIENSLKNKKLNNGVKESFGIAYRNIGLLEMDNENFERAKEHFSCAVKYSVNDSISRYNLFMIKGHMFRAKGKKEGLWSAIQNYHKATQFQPKLGEPFYYIGKTYSKIGDKEFDLILESYQKAIDLNLSPKLKKIVKSEIAIVSSREKKLKSFWK